MAERIWTDAQRDAIEARGGTLLVAAAAGSGKTAVLVERAVSRLTDPVAPTDADRLLIVTFTKAAAAEMRTRLEQRLAQLIRQDPANHALRRQAILLRQAHIGTVDSFCADLAREFFHLLDLSPDFKILSDKQQEEMMAACLDETISQAFEEGTVGDLADAFAGRRDDRQLAEMVRLLYDFTQSHPFPEQWMEEKVALYFQGDPAPWCRVILEDVQETAAHYQAVCDAAAREAEADAGPVGAAYADPFRREAAWFAALQPLAAAGDWDGTAAWLAGYAQPPRGRVPAADKDAFYQRLESLRQEVKRAAEKLPRRVPGTWAQAAEELRTAAPLLDRLRTLTVDFSHRYAQRKRDGNFLDYSDLEHCAVELFLTPEGGRTETARLVAERFDEVMIDEVQDVNEVQDSIFRAISREERNLFFVGDVKQSIYGFRRAMPEIFLRMRRALPLYDRAGKTLPAAVVLDRNFRSRPQVTDTVNFVFSRLMTRAAGDVDYRDGEQLVCGAQYPTGEGYETELAFLARPGDMDAETAEARWIARRIRTLVEEGFSVGADDDRRPARWGDFCILLRSANKHAHGYAQVLTELGVPARATVTGGFFAAAEIGVMLSLLAVIDNPDQDIPLLSVLMSPIWGFTPDDCARLREGRADRNETLYVSLLRAGERDPRCARVLEDLARFREIAATLPADTFLTLLCGATGYPDMVLSMENGAARLQNLRLLEAYAKEYEASGYHGVSGFVRFLDRLRRNESDLQAAELSPEGGDAVSIMSIHKSKGLEFPVVIVAGCGRQFASDAAASVLLHPALGLGVRLRDPVLPVRYSTTAREAILLETARENASEELRVLYVAMTRAREKLILVSSEEHPEKTLSRLALEVSGAGITPFTVRRAKSAAHWLMLCAFCHPDGAPLREAFDCPDAPVVREDYTPWRIFLEDVGETEETAADEAAPALPDEAMLARMEARIAFRYPWETALGVPAKVSASNLAEQQGARREESLSRPAWMGAKGMTPAQRGTALHTAMQYMDLASALRDPAAELARLEEEAYLLPEEAAAVDPGDLAAFAASDLGRRVLASPRAEREKRFTAVLPSRRIRPEGPDAGEEVLLQGAVDCVFEENGALCIVDFKTDRVTDMRELWDRYALQLELYGEAMEAVTGKKVSQLILWSTRLGRADARIFQKKD